MTGIQRCRGKSTHQYDNIILLFILFRYNFIIILFIILLLLLLLLSRKRFTFLTQLRWRYILLDTTVVSTTIDTVSSVQWHGHSDRRFLGSCSAGNHEYRPIWHCRLNTAAWLRIGLYIGIRSRPTAQNIILTLLLKLHSPRPVTGRYVYA